MLESENQSADSSEWSVHVPPSVGDRLTKFILTEFAEGRTDHLDDDLDLIEQGLVDSLGILELLAFMDREFGVVVPADEVIPENFRSIRALSQLIERQRR